MHVCMTQHLEHAKESPTVCVSSIRVIKYRYYFISSFYMGLSCYGLIYGHHDFLLCIVSANNQCMIILSLSLVIPLFLVIIRTDRRRPGPICIYDDLRSQMVSCLIPTHSFAISSTSVISTYRHKVGLASFDYCLNFKLSFGLTDVGRSLYIYTMTLDHRW